MTDPHAPDDAYQPVWARSAARKASRGPSFKGLIVNLLAVAAVATVVAFFAAPAVAFLGIRAAAEAGDVAGLGRLIDYDAVRASLRPQISRRPEILTPPPSILQDPLGAIRRQFEQSVAPAAPGAPPVDAYLTPQALLAVTAGEARADAPPTPGGPLVLDAPLPRPAYWSVNRARLAVPGQDGSRTLFTFERRAAFEWKLVHIGLPAATLASAAVAP